jgi:hypothetical protein
MTLTREDYEALVKGRTAEELVDLYVTAERAGHLHGMQVIRYALTARMNLWKRVAWGSTHVAYNTKDGLTIEEREA